MRTYKNGRSDADPGKKGELKKKLSLYCKSLKS